MVFGAHINKYYKKYWYLFLLGLIFLVAVDVAQLLVPLIVGDTIRALSPSRIDEFNTMDLVIENGWFKTTLGFVVLSISVIGLIITFGRIGWRLTVSKVGKLIECDMRAEMYEHVQTLSLAWFSKQKTGGLMAYFTNDLEDLSESCSSGLIYLVDIFALGCSCFVFMFITHWVLALICLVPLSAMALSSYFVMKGETVRWNLTQQCFQDMSDMAQESISGLAVIKAFVREGVEMKRFGDMNGKLKLANIRFARFSQLTSNIGVNLLIYATVLVIMAVGGYFALTPDLVFPGIPAFTDGSDAAGALSQFFGYYSSFIWPLMAIGMLIDLTSKGKASLNRVSSILDAPNEIVDSPNLRSAPVKGDVEFRDLCFSYPDSPDRPTLQHISFRAESGKSYGIVGRTGSGKSSLMTLLLKLYNVGRGQIFIDGVDLNDWYGKAIRDSIGFVSQEAFLFSDTIAGNIAFGVSKPTKERVTRSAVFADVDSNIRELPEGYETLVGERGKAVSGGQRQRISMARAAIRNPAILILDDSVSAVDAITEKHILANIGHDRKGKTTFIISSRLSVVEHLDGILVLDKGQMAGFGTHEELLKTCPVYRKMFELQALERELQ